jgi:uncharacterized repeat protein (TIGR01451 family)
MVVFGLVLAGGVTAQAAEICSDLSGTIISAGGGGAPATASVTNGSSGCTAQVTFASYKMYKETQTPGWLDTQVLFDYQTLTLAPGETKSFTVNTPTCRTQLDIYEGPVQANLSDASGGFPGMNLLDWDINMSPLCSNVQPLTCSPANQNANVDETVNFSATGGTGSYSWSSPGSPSTGAGANFSSSFSTPGTKSVTVTSGTQTATCSVSVSVTVEILSCTPVSQNINIGGIAAFSATGGTGSYSWNAPGGAPDSGSGTNFSSAFYTPGTKNVTVTSGSQTATCAVHVSVPVNPLQCSPANQNVNVGDIAVFSATGGTGIYSWNSPGSPSTGIGANFSSAFSTPGIKTVTVNSGAKSADCTVNVAKPLAQKLTCSPLTQNGTTDDYLAFSASGGTGSYSWNAPDGSPSTGNDRNFSTKFSTAGNKTVTVTSGKISTTCSAVISAPVCKQAIAYLNPATNVTETSATLNGYVDPQGKPSTYYFEYGTSAAYGQSTNAMTLSFASNVLFTVYGLQPNTTYYYRLVVQTDCGTVRSGNFTFTTGGYNPPANQIYCNPQNQNVNAGDWVNFYATGGSGNYYWSTSGDASPYSGNGSNFGTRFSQNGTKIVTVSASGGGTAQCVVYVNNTQHSNFQITKNVLNRTLGQTVFVNNVEAQAGDTVEFEIRVQYGSYGYYGNPQILVRDSLPYGLSYVAGSTRVNGNYVADGITQSVNGIYLYGAYGQEQVIRFLATVDKDRSSGTLTNQAFATINSDTRSAYASVNVRARGTVLGAADIPTGPEDVLPLSLSLGFASALFAYYFLFRRKNRALTYGIVAESSPAAKLEKSSELSKLIDSIRAEEKAPDA